MNNFIVYHLTPINDYAQRYNKTLDKIIKSGLMNKVLNFYLVFNGECNSKDLKLNDKIQIIKQDQFTNENKTINFVKKISEKLHGNLLYLHCKGVSHSKEHNINCVNDWVDMMEYFLIERYKDCLIKLNSYATVGCNLKVKNDFHGAHYSGNFWWSKTDYIKNKEEITNIYDRMEAEMWLLNKSDYENHYSMHDSNISSHYVNRYPRSKYLVNAPTR